MPDTQWAPFAVPDIDDFLYQPALAESESLASASVTIDPDAAAAGLHLVGTPQLVTEDGATQPTGVTFRLEVADSDEVSSFWDRARFVDIAITYTTTLNGRRRTRFKRLKVARKVRV